MSASSNVTLSLGYDTERPYGEWARTEPGHALRRQQLACVERLNRCFDELEAPRTFFLLGDYLEQCARHDSVERLRALYDPSNPLIDIQQHSYSHPNIRPIPGRPIEPIATAAEFGRDIRRATSTIDALLGARVTGLRIPRGYDEDLSSAPDIAAEIDRAGISFVSSDLRSPSNEGGENFHGALDRHRQPHGYAPIGYPNLLEIPSHGYQDVAFTRAIAGRCWQPPPQGTDQIAEHYVGLLRRALSLAPEIGDVHVALCLHPFAVMEYDPELWVHRHLIGWARSEGIELLSYHALAQRTRGT